MDGSAANYVHTTTREVVLSRTGRVLKTKRPCIMAETSLSA